MDDHDRSIIPLPDGSLSDMAAGAERIISAMVGEALSIAHQEEADKPARSELIEQRYDAPIPPEKMDAMIPAIVNLAKEAPTPEKFAASLLKLGPKAPEFSQSLWFLAKGGGAKGPDRPNWAQIYADLAQSQDEQVVQQQSSEERGHKFNQVECKFCKPDYQQILIWAKALALEPSEVIQRLIKCGTMMGRGLWFLTPSDPLFESKLGEAVACAAAYLNSGYRSPEEVLQHFRITFAEMAEYRLEMLCQNLGEIDARLKALQNWSSTRPESVQNHFRGICGNLRKADSLSPDSTDWRALGALATYSKFILGSRHRDAPPLFISELRCRFELLPISRIDFVPGLQIETVECIGDGLDVLDVRQLQHLQTLGYNASSTRLIQRPDQSF